jgi:flagellar biosynthesis anti-sigma factor FlgM
MEPLSSTPPSSASPSRRAAALQTVATLKEKGERSTAPQESVPVSLSQSGQDIHHYTEAMAEIPDIRQERIIEIQLALEKGTYSVSAHDLAGKLIQEISSHTPDESSSST